MSRGQLKPMLYLEVRGKLPPQKIPRVTNMTAVKLCTDHHVMHCSFVSLQQPLGLCQEGAIGPVALGSVTAVSFDVHGEGLDCFVSLVAERTLMGLAGDVTISNMLE